MTQAQASSAPPHLTIGIDLGDRKSSYCILDAGGQVVGEGSLSTHRHAFEERFGGLGAARVVVEVSTHSRWVSKCLEELGHTVVVANPRQFRLISESDRKSDRNDARLLAQVGRTDPELLRPITPRSERSTETRVLLNARRQLVGMRTALVNRIRMEAKVAGARIPHCSAECFSERAEKHLPESLRPALRPLLEILAELQKRIEAYDKQVARLCQEQYPEVKILCQVHGVGLLVGLTYAVTIDSPERFASSRNVGSYLGLTPQSYQSGKRNPQLRISRAGDGELRALLVGAAAYILRRSSPACDLKRYGERIARGGSSRDRARARVAVARKLAVLLHRLWSTGEVYDPNRALRQAG